MNKDKKEPEYPVELETQFIMRLPEEPAKALRESLRSEENLRNRLTIQLEDDMRHGEVRFDHWLLHAKIVDLPTIIESLKTIDRKSLYKTADICQMMICKEEAEPLCIEEESPVKNKKKDPFKVDKKFLFSHGITPPTKNVRKRRFRKTLKKKSAEAPEIEKEVKRLLRADNEAVSVTWEIIKEDEEIKPEPSNAKKSEKSKIKKDHKVKMESSKVEDIFGEAVSDSDIEENINVEIEHLNRLSTYDDHLSDSNSIQGSVDYKSTGYLTQFRSEMFKSQDPVNNFAQASTSHNKMSTTDLDLPVDNLFQQTSNVNEDINLKLQKVRGELEELKQKRQHTQQEISGMANMTLRQRFQNILESLNKEIHFKEKECKKLQYSLKKV